MWVRVPPGAPLTYTRITRAIQLKDLGDGNFEGTSDIGGYDFVIQKQDDNTYVLAFFNSAIENPDDAYIEEFDVDTLDEAICDADTYVLSV